MQRRRITISGVKPVGSVPYGFENFYGDGAIAPTTGESSFLEFPHLNTVNFQIFLPELAGHYQETRNVVLMDNGRCHKAKSLVTPPHVVCLCLPPSTPELNPIARRWQDINEQLAWGLAASIEELEHQVEMIIQRYPKVAIQSLTAYLYLVHAVNALSS
jgi:hypothetical protein